MNKRRLPTAAIAFLAAALLAAVPHAALAQDIPQPAGVFGFVAHPNVALLLLTLGFYGLVYEFSTPGVFAPGVIGGICLLLGLYACNVLPVDYTGLALVGLGLALMTAEAFTPTFGALGIGGTAAFVMGSTMLFDAGQDGAYAVDLWVVAVLALTSLGFLSVVVGMAVKAQRLRPTTGIDELTAATGEVVAWTGSEGQVRVTGEIWKARAQGNASLKKGDKVRIMAVDGLCLTVAPA